MCGGSLGPPGRVNVGSIGTSSSSALCSAGGSTITGLALPLAFLGGAVTLRLSGFSSELVWGVCFVGFCTLGGILDQGGTRREDVEYAKKADAASAGEYFGGALHSP